MIYPVIFRKEKIGPKEWRVVAVLPTTPWSADNPHTMTVFDDEGHGPGSLDWYRHTVPATEDEYRELKREMESAPYEYELKIYQRITPNLRDALEREWRRVFGRGR